MIRRRSLGTGKYGILCGSVVEHRSAESKGLRSEDSDFFLCPTLVTRRKIYFLYFFTELKT